MCEAEEIGIIRCSGEVQVNEVFRQGKYAMSLVATNIKVISALVWIIVKYTLMNVRFLLFYGDPK